MPGYSQVGGAKYACGSNWFDQRAELMAAEPEVYYVTDHYVNYPTVLVRLSRIHRDSLRDLLKMAWLFVTSKNKRGGRKVSTSSGSRAAD
jgi:hypothetical protein